MQNHPIAYKLSSTGTLDKLSEESNDDVPVIIPKEDDGNTDTPSEIPSYEDMQKMLEDERRKAIDCKDKLVHALADFQNLSKRTQSDIEKGVNAKMDEFMVEFLKICDDFERAKEAFSEQNMDVGLNSILKNIDLLLAKYNIKPINALGEIFDPNMHEAISVMHDPDLDENTITKEIRKGYISYNRIIRPTLVEISKKIKDELK